MRVYKKKNKNAKQEGRYGIMTIILGEDYASQKVCINTTSDESTSY